jgi:hypothetical protein
VTSIFTIVRSAIPALATLALLSAAPARPQSHPEILPSWNVGPTRQAIVDFVAAVTSEGGATFVPPAERIATFDNDGTLWAEQPLYVQGMFAIDRARELAVRDPRLAAKQPYKAILQNDWKALAGASESEIGGLLAATHTGMTPEDFAHRARSWLDRARHPRFGRLYKELAYQPMIELLDYLRANHFKTYIVSGGGIDFLRAFSVDAYGVPPEQVIGSSAATRFAVRGSQADLIKLPKLNSLDDKEGKPININLHIGRRPILAGGNSDGDLPMLQYAASDGGARLLLLVHHDDAEREYAYDRRSRVGRLDKALDEAMARNWVVVSMKRDWKVVFPRQDRGATGLDAKRALQ